VRTPGSCWASRSLGVRRGDDLEEAAVSLLLTSVKQNIPSRRIFAIFCVYCICIEMEALEYVL